MDPPSNIYQHQDTCGGDGASTPAFTNTNDVTAAGVAQPSITQINGVIAADHHGN